MTKKESKDVAETSLAIAGITAVGVALLSAAILPWYAAIGAGVLMLLLTFLFFAVLFSIEVPK